MSWLCQFLNLVTGVKGLMARSVVATGTKHQNGAWHNSTAYPGWTWKGDTSSDEVRLHDALMCLLRPPPS